LQAFPYFYIALEHIHKLTAVVPPCRRSRTSTSCWNRSTCW
jgi:hypothetical protein